MRHRCVNPALLAGLLSALTATALADTHLLLTEVVTTPSTDQYIEIGNPTTSPIALADYYLTDTSEYARLPGEFGAGPAPAIDSADFIARFPMRAILPAGGVIVVAVDGTGFFDSFGAVADYEILGTDPGTPDLLEAYPNSIGFLTGLANGGEGIAIFHWDGLSDLVDDVDIMRVGTAAALDDVANKTGLAVDGPDPGSRTTTYLDDAYTMPVQPASPGIGLSTKRVSLELLREVHAGGNGITGDDETTEDIAVTWDSAFTVPTPGTSLTINPQSGVVLAVAKTGESTVTAGMEMTYTIFVQNSGSDPAFNVLITDTLPTGVTFVSEVSPPTVNNFDTTDPEISWVAGTLGAGDSFLIDLTVFIDAGVDGVITNHVEVFTTSLNDDPGDNTDTHPTTVSASSPALSMVKTGPPAAVADTDVTYTLTIENTGPGLAENVFVTDNLPPGVTYVSDVSPPGVFIIDVVEPQLEWDVGTVMSGEMLEIGLTVRIDAGVSGDIENFATVTTTSTGDNPADNTDSANTSVTLPAADISVTKAGPATALAGTSIVYTLELRNNGAGPADDVILTDTLPAGLTFAGESSPPGVTLIDATAPDIVWDAGTVGPGATVTVDLTVAIDFSVSGDITNDVAFTTSTPGDDPMDNFASAVTAVTIPVPELSVTKTTDAKAFPGMELVYTIIVENAGAGPANGVIVTDTLPAGLDFVDEISPPSVTIRDTGEPTIEWDAGTLDPGAMVIIQLTAEIDTDITGPITNTVDVTTTSVGDDPADNTDSADTEVIALLPMLSLAKSGPVSAVNGTEITYSILVQNTGNSVAETVRISDMLPAAATFVSESSPAGVSFNLTDGGTVPTWTAGTLAPFGTLSVSLTVFIDSAFTGNLVNSAEVTTNTDDEDPAGNLDTAMTMVVDPVFPEDILINEIRISQTGDDKDEFFELKGDPGATLNAVTYLVIGDSDSGRIEEVVTLTGQTIQPDGFFVVAQGNFQLDPTAVIDLEEALNFEDPDNVTHLLVFQFTGLLGDDLDDDDDGTLDTLPWTAVLDAVGVLEEPNPPKDTEWAYGASLGFVDVGPDGPLPPAHVYRCGPDAEWAIGTQDEEDLYAVDTPDGANAGCPCIEDTNVDGVIDIDDVINVVLCFDTDGIDCPSIGDRSDVDHSGTVDIDDLIQVVLQMGPCP